MDDKKEQEAVATPAAEQATPEVAQQGQQIDVEAMLEEMQGLRNQRNSAFDDAANIFGKLQKVTKMFNGLYAAFATLKNKYEPVQPVPAGPALKDPVAPASVPTTPEVKA